MKIQRGTAILLTIAAGVTVAVSEPARAHRGRASHQSLPAALEQLDATDLRGERWTAERLRGRVVLLDFWATWCAPCLAELPRLEALRNRHSRADFEILGVSLDAISRRSFVSWLNRHRIDWPQIHERGGYNAPTARLFAIERLPATIVVNRDGSIAGVDVRGERLGALIDLLVESRR